MQPLTLDAHEGTFSLWMSVCHAPAADAVVEALGHTPNGYFWEGVAQALLEGPLAEHAAAIDFSSEGDTFVAMASEAPPLEALGQAMAALLADPDALRAFVSAALDAGFEFDD